jgi:von Willebrand factor
MDKFGDVKVGLSSKFTKTVDGLCGFYNGKPEDDKRMPNGLPAQTTLEFGDSWLSDEKYKETCEPHVCPKHLQDFAWNMCNAVK